MAELSPKEREIEELKAKLAGLETQVAGLETSLTSCPEGEREIALLGAIAATRQQIAATLAALTQLRGQAAGGGEPFHLPLVVFFSLSKTQVKMSFFLPLCWVNLCAFDCLRNFLILFIFYAFDFSHAKIMNVLILHGDH
jgi:hypothetical protein